METPLIAGKAWKTLGNDENHSNVLCCFFLIILLLHDLAVIQGNVVQLPQCIVFDLLDVLNLEMPVSMSTLVFQPYKRYGCENIIELCDNFP